MSTETFFEDTEHGLVGRSRDGEPLIIPPGGSPDGPKMPYTRASQLADFLVDHRYIARWRSRYLAKGLGKHEDLAALAGIETYSTGYDEPDIGEKKASGRRLDDIIERVLDRERIYEKANRGTVFHAATDPGFEGHTPARLEQDVLSFNMKMKECGIEILATELFMVCDELRVAGTFDHLIRMPSGPPYYGMVAIADKKTGEPKPDEFAIQLSIYAHGLLYDINTGERIELASIAEGQAHDENTAFVFMTSDGKTTIHELDVLRGYENARLAAQVRDRQRDTAGLMARVDERLAKRRKAEILARIATAITVAELFAIYESLRPWWPDDLRAAASKRKEALKHDYATTGQ